MSVFSYGFTPEGELIPPQWDEQCMVDTLRLSGGLSAMGAEIQFDETAQAPFFHYYGRVGVEHEVWFEDVRSLQAKFHLIDELSLRGLGYWQIMQLFRANRLLLAERFRILK